MVTKPLNESERESEVAQVCFFFNIYPLLHFCQKKYKSIVIIMYLYKYAGHHIRIIAVTASSHAEDERKCISAGMDGFIAKPVSPQTLYNAIAQS